MKKTFDNILESHILPIALTVFKTMGDYFCMSRKNGWANGQSLSLDVQKHEIIYRNNCGDFSPFHVFIGRKGEIIETF